MNKKPYTWAGTSLSSTDYESWFPDGQTVLSSASPTWTPGAASYPYLSGTLLAGGNLRMSVQALGTVQDQQETLKALFDIDADNAKNLVIEDTSTTDTTRWYVAARPLSFNRIGVSNVFDIAMALNSPVWLTTTQTTEATWSVTDTAATTDIVIDLGNLSAYPVIEVTPNAARGAGDQYRRFVQLVNTTTRSAANYPIDITNGGLDTSALVADTATFHTINGALNSDTDVIPINLPSTDGGLPTSGVGYTFDASSSDREQISWTGNTGTELTGVTRGVGGTIASAHNSGVVIYLSHLYADGSDIRVRKGTTEGNLTEQPFWLSTTDLASSTDTKIWMPITIASKVVTDLRTAIGTTDTEIRHVLVTPRPLYPTSGGTILINSERITYTEYNPDRAEFTGCTRGAFGTTAASHSVGADIYLIPIIYMFYGNGALSALAYNTSRRPVFNLSTSTNTSWVFQNFYQFVPTQITADRWTQAVSGTLSSFYTVSQDYTLTTSVDPAAVMGCTIVKSAAYVRWNAAFAFGFTSALFSNVYRRNLPTNYARIQSWYQSATQSTFSYPAATTVADTWQLTASITHTPASPHRFIRWQLLNPSANDITQAAVEVATVTVTLSSTTDNDGYGVPTVTLGAEESIDYSADFTIENTTTGLSISWAGEIPFNETLQIDTLNKTVTALWDNTNKYTGLVKSTIRDEWLALSQGTNTLTYTETGVTGIDVVVKWQGRNN